MPKELIVIEGSDASGKKTQTRLLCMSLKSPKTKIASFSFPVYNSPTGRIVTSYLNGEFGPVGSIDPKIASIWYAMNRYEYKPVLERALSDSIVVCDRYVESNMGHQGGKIASPAERGKFFEWCENLEYEEFKLPRPTLGIFLHVPWKISSRLAAMRGATDGHEADPDHLKMAEEAYQQLADKYKWHIIECRGDDGVTMRSMESIAADVLKIVMNHLAR